MTIRLNLQEVSAIFFLLCNAQGNVTAEGVQEISHETQPATTSKKGRDH